MRCCVSNIAILAMVFLAIGVVMPLATPIASFLSPVSVGHASEPVFNRGTLSEDYTMPESLWALVGDGTPLTPNDLEPFYSVAEEGNALAALLIGGTHAGQTPLTENNIAEGRKWLLVVTGKFNGLPEYYLGQLCDDKFNTMDPDPQCAEDWYLASHRLGNNDGSYRLAFKLFERNNYADSYPIFLQLLEKPDYAQYSTIHFFVGYTHLYGSLNVPVNVEKAAFHFLQSAENKPTIKSAVAFASIFYRLGIGVEKDLLKADQLAEQAVDLGMTPEQINLIQNSVLEKLNDQHQGGSIQ